jgi:hypothetical protein
VIKRLLAWSKSKASYISWGKGKVFGSFVPVVTHDRLNHQLMLVYTNASVEIQFETLQSRPSFQPTEKRMELLARLNAIPGVNIPESSITQRPSIKAALLAEGDNLDRLLAIYEWVVTEILEPRPRGSAT